MTITTEEIKGTIVLHLDEERLDAHNSADLKVEMQRLFEAGNLNLLVNLKNVRFIDSSGLGAMDSG